MTRHRITAAAIAGLLTFVTACGSNAPAGRAYELRLRTEDSGDTYAYIAEDELDLRVGDEVTFQMRNTGALPHDLQVVDPSGAAIGTAPAVASRRGFSNPTGTVTTACTSSVEVLVR